MGRCRRVLLSAALSRVQFFGSVMGVVYKLLLSPSIISSSSMIHMILPSSVAVALSKVSKPSISWRASFESILD